MFNIEQLWRKNHDNAHLGLSVKFDANFYFCKLKL